MTTEFLYSFPFFIGVLFFFHLVLFLSDNGEMANDNPTSDGVFEVKVLSVLNVESGARFYVTVDDLCSAVTTATPDRTARFTDSPINSFVFHGKGGHTKDQRTLKLPSPFELRVYRKKKRSRESDDDDEDSDDDGDEIESQRKRTWWKRLKTNDKCLGRGTIDFRDYIARPCSTVEVQLIGVVCTNR